MRAFLEALLLQDLRLYATPKGVRCFSQARPRPNANRPSSFLGTASSSRAQDQCSRRPFHHSLASQKKGGGKASKKQQASAGDETASPGASEDPYDFTELSDLIATAHATLKDGLSKLRAGGRFNPEVVENLRISLDKTSKETMRLADLAQVVPRGRQLNIIAGEKDHAKAIASAIQSSSLNLTPQIDAQNPTQLNVQLPPPTTELRQQAVKTAQELADKANMSIRNARGGQQKKLRAMTLGKAARPDDLKKAGDRMEKVVADGGAEVKRILDGAKKALESG